jgi:hypothetical protein
MNIAQWGWTLSCVLVIECIKMFIWKYGKMYMSIQATDNPTQPSESNLQEKLHNIPCSNRRPSSLKTSMRWRTSQGSYTPGIIKENYIFNAYSGITRKSKMLWDPTKNRHKQTTIRSWRACLYVRTRLTYTVTEECKIRHANGCKAGSYLRTSGVSRVAFPLGRRKLR